jgi:chromosome segregation ATPase
MSNITDELRAERDTAEAEVARQAWEKAKLRAENDRLTVEIAALREQPHEYVFEAEKQIERLRAQNAEAAAFLDLMAYRLTQPVMAIDQTAADCRAMAAKLRGET